MLGIDLRWWVFLHLVGVVAFLLAHGAAVTLYFRLRTERDRTRIREMIQFSGSTVVAMYLGMLLLLGGGIAAGFAEHVWGQLWIWAALILLVAVTALMSAVVAPYY